MPSDKTIDFVLNFPEGDFLIAGRGIYFMPKDAKGKAYLGWGGHKELLGKHHRELETRSEEFKTYDVTYEIEDGELVSARLISPKGKSAGTLADTETVQKLNEDLQSGALELVGRANPPHITRAAKFGDGRILLLIEGLDKSSRHTLLVGTPGHFEQFKLKNGVQGGNSFYYKTEDGTEVALPYGMGGPRAGESPQFGDEYLAYIELEDRFDFAAFKISIAEQDPHLDPFCPELSRQQVQPISRPKGPSR